MHHRQAEYILCGADLHWLCLHDIFGTIKTIRPDAIRLMIGSSESALVSSAHKMPTHSNQNKSIAEPDATSLHRIKP